MEIINQMLHLLAHLDLKKMLKILRSNGLALGGSLENAVVVGERKNFK